MAKRRPYAGVGDGGIGLVKLWRHVDGKLQACQGVLAGEIVTGDLGGNRRRQVRIVLELDALPQLEGHGQAVRGYAPGFGQVTLNRPGKSLPGVKPKQCVVCGQELRSLEAVAIVGVVATENVGSAIPHDPTGLGLSPVRLVARALQVPLDRSLVNRDRHRGGDRCRSRQNWGRR